MTLSISLKIKTSHDCGSNLECFLSYLCVLMKIPVPSQSFLSPVPPLGSQTNNHRLLEVGQTCCPGLIMCTRWKLEQFTCWGRLQWSLPDIWGAYSLPWAIGSDSGLGALRMALSSIWTAEGLPRREHSPCPKTMLSLSWHLPDCPNMVNWENQIEFECTLNSICAWLYTYCTRQGVPPGNDAGPQYCGTTLDFHGKGIMEDPFAREWAFCQSLPAES